MQGQMSLCLHIMVIWGTIIFRTQRDILNNKIFDANY